MLTQPSRQLKQKQFPTFHAVQITVQKLELLAINSSDIVFLTKVAFSIFSSRPHSTDYFFFFQADKDDIKEFQNSYSGVSFSKELLRLNS